MQFAILYVIFKAEFMNVSHEFREPNFSDFRVTQFLEDSFIYRTETKEYFG